MTERMQRIVAALDRLPPNVQNEFLGRIEYEIDHADILDDADGLVQFAGADPETTRRADWP